MKNFRVRRAWAVVATVALAAAMLPVMLAGTASAVTATVSTDAEFFDAWTDSSVTQIDLANDIDLEQYGDCGFYPERTQTDPTLLDGHGFTLTQTCDSNSTVFVDSGTAPLTVQNITITHAGAPNPTVFGNGIYSPGPITVLNSTITGNWTNGCPDLEDVSAAWLCSPIGGGIASDDTVTVDGSSVTNNRAQVLGGGIAARNGLTVTDSTVADNVVEWGDYNYAFGGGAWSDGGASVTGSTFSGNVATCGGECAPAGGGLAAQGGDVTITSSAFDGNAAECEMYCSNVGGGVLVGDGNLTITGSSITSNDVSCEDSCEAAGGGIFASDGYFYDSVGQASLLGSDVQAGAVVGAHTTITDSTIAGNTATTTDAEGGDCECSGGGLVSDGQDLVTVTRSTISGNTALHWGGGLSLWYEGTDLHLENSTVTGNTAGGAGGVDVADAVAVVVYSTIDGNTATGDVLMPVSTDSTRWGARAADVRAAIADLPANMLAWELTTFGTVYADPAGGPNCVVYNEGGTDSEGYNFSDDDSCGLTGTGDQENAGSPMLNALAANGGPTATMMPYTPKLNGVTSPLIDAIPVAACQTGSASGVGTDQRGVTRPQLEGCDIGAVEVTGEEYEVAAEQVVIQPRFTG